MTRIAVTGHRNLSNSVSSKLAAAIAAELSRYPSQDLTGISCLADGADQIFARAVLAHKGQLEVVLPSHTCRDDLPDAAQLTFDELLKQATEVTVLDHASASPAAHMAASVHMLRRADLLFAVWDGEPARAFGGTADVVSHARQRGLPTLVIWPAGAFRD